MSPFRFAKSIIQKADFFSTTQLFRYQQQPQFKTVTGGICSIGIIVVVAILFFQMALTTVNRQTVIWTSHVIKQHDPQPLNVSFSNFKMGIELLGINLTDTLKYFDVVLFSTTYDVNLNLSNSTYYPLQPCRAQNWNITADILEDFNRIGGDSWLCPPDNASFVVQGKYSSNRITIIQVDIMACGTYYKNQTCANQTQVEGLLNQTIFFTLYFVNALVDPENLMPVSYYLEDNYYISITNTLGGNMRIPISDYTITTDYSLLPIENKDVMKGGYVQDLGTNALINPTPQFISRIWFQKSRNQYTFSRSFTKFDAVVSYVGGLFGAIIGIMFIMNHYTMLSFEIILGSRVYNDENNQPLTLKSLNFFRYAGYGLYGLLETVGYKCNWKIMKKYDQCRDEITRQLDVKFLIERITFLERGFITAFGQDKFRALHLKNKCTFDEAKYLREMYYLGPTLKNQIVEQKIQKTKTNITNKNNQAFQKKEVFMLDQIKSNSGEINNNPSQLNPYQDKQKSYHSKKHLSSSKKLVKINLGNKIYPIQNIQQDNSEFISVRDGIQDSKGKHITFKQNVDCISDDKGLTVLQSMKNKQESQIPSYFQFQIDNQVLKSLQAVKQQAIQGDQFSQAIWDDMDPQIKKKINNHLNQRSNYQYNESAVSFMKPKYNWK